MSFMGNPIASQSMGQGAAADLGLGQGASQSAADLAEELRKKKLLDQKAIAAAGSAVAPGNAAVTSLFSGMG